MGWVKPNRESFHPVFDRDREIAIANAIAIHPDTPVIVVEGNYLLLNEAPWRSMHDVFSASVFVCPSLSVLQDRSVHRWIHYGYDADAALDKALSNDLPNAQRIIEGSAGADIVLRQNGD